MFCRHGERIPFLRASTIPIAPEHVGIFDGVFFWLFELDLVVSQDFIQSFNTEVFAALILQWESVLFITGVELVNRIVQLTLIFSPASLRWLSSIRQCFTAAGVGGLIESPGCLPKGGFTNRDWVEVGSRIARTSTH